MPHQLVFQLRNLDMDASCDLLDLQNVPAESKVSSVQHVEEFNVRRGIHLSMDAQSYVDSLNHLTNDRPHHHQLVNQAGGEELVQLNSLQISTHFEQKVSVEGSCAIGDVHKGRAIPVEFSYDKHQQSSDPGRNRVRGLGHPECLMSMVDVLQSSSILILLFSLSARYPPGSHDRDESTDRLRPAGPLGFVQVEAHANRDEKRSHHQNECPKLDGSDLKEELDYCHIGILAC